MATANTNKNSLTFAIGFVAVAALVASPRRVASINRVYLDAALAGYVLDLQEERRKRPSVVNQSLLFGDLDSRSNAFEVFDSYCSRAVFQGFIHDLVGYVPEQPFNRSLLFARQPFQKPPLIAALAPCGLKIAALFESALSNVFDNSAFKNLASAGRDDANDTRINADHTIAAENPEHPS